MTLPGVAEHPKRSQDRLFKWVAAVGGRLPGRLRGLRDRPRVARTRRRVGSAALESPPPPVLRAGTSGPGLLAPAAAGDAVLSCCRTSGQAGDRQLLRLVVPRLPGRTPRDGSCRPGDHGSPERGRSGLQRDLHCEGTAAARRRRCYLSRRLDAQAKVASQYLVQALPVTYFLNGSGQVVGAALGPQRRQPRWTAGCPDLGRPGEWDERGGEGEVPPPAARPETGSEKRLLAPAPIDRSAALTEGAPGIPLKFVYWGLGVVLVLSLGGLVGEHLFSAAGLNPVADDDGHIHPRRAPVTTPTVPPPADSLQASLGSFMGLSSRHAARLPPSP